MTLWSPELIANPTFQVNANPTFQINTSGVNANLTFQVNTFKSCFLCDGR